MWGAGSGLQVWGVVGEGGLVTRRRVGGGLAPGLREQDSVCRGSVWCQGGDRRKEKLNSDLGEKWALFGGKSGHQVKWGEG